MTDVGKVGCATCTWHARSPRVTLTMPPACMDWSTQRPSLASFSLKSCNCAISVPQENQLSPALEMDKTHSDWRGELICPRRHNLALADAAKRNPRSRALNSAASLGCRNRICPESCEGMPKPRSPERRRRESLNPACLQPHGHGISALL